MHLLPLRPAVPCAPPPGYCGGGRWRHDSVAIVVSGDDAVRRQRNAPNCGAWARTRFAYVAGHHDVRRASPSAAPVKPPGHRGGGTPASLPHLGYRCQQPRGDGSAASATRRTAPPGRGRSSHAWSLLRAIVIPPARCPGTAVYSARVGGASVQHRRRQAAAAAGTELRSSGAVAIAQPRSAARAARRKATPGHASALFAHAPAGRCRLSRAPRAASHRGDGNGDSAALVASVAGGVDPGALRRQGSAPNWSQPRLGPSTSGRSTRPRRRATAAAGIEPSL